LIRHVGYGALFPHLIVHRNLWQCNHRMA